MTKALFIKTYGCQMNVYDSERMTELLAPLVFMKRDLVNFQPRGACRAQCPFVPAA